MKIQEDAKAESKLRRVEMARALIGVAVIVAVFAVIFCGINAFTQERDTWLAMRLPLSIAVALVWGFARSAKAIVAFRATRPRYKKIRTRC